MSSALDATRGLDDAHTCLMNSHVENDNDQA